MAQNNLGCCLGAVLSAQRLHKVALGVHQVEVYAVVYQIVLTRSHVLGRAKVHSVRLAHVLDLVVCARQADEGGVEFGQVLLQHLGGVAFRVTGDEDGQDGAGALGLDQIKHAGHLVEFLRADIGAMGEAKVNL